MMSDDASTSGNSFDIIIVGAGISGINAAYRIQKELPGASYTIIEARGAIGGTWDLFRFPGIRSDSDLYTFSFPWRPWIEENSIASGESIRKYIQESAAINGIDRRVQFHHKLVSANWSSDQQAWTLLVDAQGQKKYFYGRFVMMSTGYFDHEEALASTIPGLQSFKGSVVHPQFWPEGFDYTDKKIVVIGSGATAVTLIPVLAETASHVTMLQRSPGYIVVRPSVDPTAQWLSRYLPTWLVFSIVRLKYLILPFLFILFCNNYPNAARNTLKKATLKQLPANIPHDPHFKPKYNPWEQRLNLDPDSKLFVALRSGKASVATGVIKTVTEDSIIMESCESIATDIIVTATGLKLQVTGGTQISVDGHPAKITDKFLWKGALIQDLPNMAAIIGYTDASWTLGADATAQHICRLLKYMRSHKYTSAVPRVDNASTVRTLPFLNLNSTYVEKGKGSLPKGGDVAPWKPRWVYFADLWEARFGSLTKGLEFSRISV